MQTKTMTFIPCLMAGTGTAIQTLVLITKPLGRKMFLKFVTKPHKIAAFNNAFCKCQFFGWTSKTDVNDLFLCAWINMTAATFRNNHVTRLLENPDFFSN